MGNTTYLFQHLRQKAEMKMPVQATNHLQKQVTLAAAFSTCLSFIMTRKGPGGRQSIFRLFSEVQKKR